MQIGLKELQSARDDLTRATSGTQNGSKIYAGDPSKTAIISIESETIETLIIGISKTAELQVTAFLSDIQMMKGQLPLPVNGRVIREFNQEDAAGINRLGIIVATSPPAVVVAPTVATIRYQGQLLGYGMVSILEPKKDILLVFSGLEKTFGRIGDIIYPGDPLGIMSGGTSTAKASLQESINTTSAYRSQTLYLEVRENQTPQNPLLWFDFKEDEP